MLNISKSVIVPYTAAQIYALVSDIDNYQNYLPWCPSSKIIKEEHNKIVGRVDVGSAKIHVHFTTLNSNIPNERIDMQLVDGPFRHFQGHWLFSPLDSIGCKIEFKLEYKFSNLIIEKIVGAAFELAIKNIVDTFIKKAHEVYCK